MNRTYTYARFFSLDYHALDTLCTTSFSMKTLKNTLEKERTNVDFFFLFDAYKNTNTHQNNILINKKRNIINNILSEFIIK